MTPIVRKEILVTTDFSVNALNAIKYAFAFSEITNSKIILLHALDSLQLSISPSDKATKAEKEMLTLVDSLKLLFPHVACECAIVQGNASDTIVDFIKQRNIQLLIIGTQGKGADKDNLIGSTTEKIIAETPCTIIAIPPKAKFIGIHKVAIAIGLEEGGLLAINEAVILAKQLNAEITLVHVEDLELNYLEDVLYKMVVKLKRQTEYLKIFYHICKDLDIINGLNAFVRLNKPDILSMITLHNKSFPKSTGEHSWTNKMSHHTSIPVLILHADKPNESKSSNNIEIDKPISTT